MVVWGLEECLRLQLSPFLASAVSTLSLHSRIFATRNYSSDSVLQSCICSWSESPDPLHTALLCTLDHVYYSTNAHKSTILMSHDLSAAFDTIDHSILLNRLHSTFGISGATLQWITSYLTNCSQYVKLGNCSSDHTLSASGVLHLYLSVISYRRPSDT